MKITKVVGTEILTGVDATLTLPAVNGTVLTGSFGSGTAAVTLPTDVTRSPDTLVADLATNALKLITLPAPSSPTLEITWSQVGTWSGSVVTISGQLRNVVAVGAAGLQTAGFNFLAPVSGTIASAFGTSALFNDTTRVPGEFTPSGYSTLIPVSVTVGSVTTQYLQVVATYATDIVGVVPTTPVAGVNFTGQYVLA